MEGTGGGNAAGKADRPEATAKQMVFAGIAAVFVAAAVIVAISSRVGDWKEHSSWIFVQIVVAGAGAGAVGAAYGYHVFVSRRERTATPYTAEERSRLEHDLKALGPAIGGGMGLVAAILNAVL